VVVGWQEEEDAPVFLAFYTLATAWRGTLVGHQIARCSRQRVAGGYIDSREGSGIS
jgi:hypothetical protein